MALSKTSNNKKYEGLEVSLISAFDLDPPSSEGLKIHAVIWVDPTRKLTSSAVADTTNPTWNEPFLFIVDAEALNRLTTACVTVELYAEHRGSENDAVFLGRSRALLGMLSGCGRNYADASVGALREYHVRRQYDGKTRGVLNLGFTVLQGLPVTDDKLVATGLAVDFETMIRHGISAGRGGGRKRLTAAVQGLFGKLLNRKVC